MEPPPDPLAIQDVLWRFMVAAIAGAILGLPAQLKGRPGGIRTHALVSLGAAVFCITALAVVGPTSEDLLRVIQGIASAVGFIGGAAVLRGDKVVQGINTAASIWISAAVGIAISFIASPALGILAALVATAINWGLMTLDLRMEHRMQQGADKPGRTDAAD
ncbi:MAG UNVERIFIED_CONTAM: MgtC/SapB family protein [Thermobifida fusca]